MVDNLTRFPIVGELKFFFFESFNDLFLQVWYITYML